MTSVLRPSEGMRRMGENARRRIRGTTATIGDSAWLVDIAEGASRDAGGLPLDLFGQYLPVLTNAAISGSRPSPDELEAVSELGRRAAGLGISAGRVVKLYLSAARRLADDLPMVLRLRDRDAVCAATTAVLHVVDQTIAALAEGYAIAHRDLVRHDEGLRRELIDDLLRGDSDLGAVVDRAEPFGLDLARIHQVVLAAPSNRLPDTAGAISALEAVVFDRLGDRDVLVGSKQGLLVVLAPIEPPSAGPVSDMHVINDLGQIIYAELSHLPRGCPWRVAVGRAHPGLYGIARSYGEARESLTMAARLHLNRPILNFHDLLIYRVLLRDQPAIVDLVQAVLEPAAPGTRRSAAFVGHPGNLLRYGRCDHTSRETPTPECPNNHLPAGTNQGFDRLHPD